MSRNKIITYRKLYRKLAWEVFTTIRPFTGSSYYMVGEDYDHYYRKRFLFTGTIIKKIAPMKLKDIPEDIIANDVDPPYNTKEEFYKMMEKFYKDNYFRKNFWKGWDTPFQILWFRKLSILARWA